MEKSMYTFMFSLENTTLFNNGRGDGSGNTSDITIIITC